MGNLNLNKQNKITNLDDVHTTEQFTNLVNNHKTYLHKQMLAEKRGCKIFIGRRLCEFDETDPDIIEEYKSDYILSQYKHQYYIAEITFDQTADWPAFANLLSNDIESVMSYSFNIYCLHRKYSEFKTCVVLKYYTPKRINRSKSSIYSMSDDLIDISQYLDKLTAKEIEDRQLVELSSSEKRKRYEYINKNQIGIYDKIYNETTNETFNKISKCLV